VLLVKQTGFAKWSLTEKFLPWLHHSVRLSLRRSTPFINVDMIHLLAPDFFLFCAFLSPLLAQNTYFTTPPTAGAELSFHSDPVYAVNSQVQLGWVTDVGSYSIWLWQQAGGKLGSASCGSQIYSRSILRRLSPLMHIIADLSHL
jgi:hypothetical protein